MEKPSFKIEANGNDITSIIRDRLESLSVHDATGSTSDMITIELDNRDNAIYLPSTGAELNIWIGLGEKLTYKGLYQVTEIEEPMESFFLTITATASAFKGEIKSPKSRSFDDITLGQLAEKIAKENNLTPVISNDLSIIHFDHIDQTNESDLNLLTRLGKEFDAVAKPVAGRLLITKKGAGKTASGKDMPEITIDDPSGTTGRITITERSNYNSVLAVWFDENTQQKYETKAGLEPPVFTLKQQFVDEKSAKYAAEAKLERFQRGKKTLSIQRPLTPELTAESRVTIKNHKQSANGSWIAESVDHSISGSGFATTSVKLVLPK